MEHYKNSLLEIKSIVGKVIIAAAGCYLEIVEYLLTCNPDINTLNLAYKEAIYNEKWEIAKYLFEKGANINFNRDFAIRMASGTHNWEFLKYLVEHGANIHAENGDVEAPFLKQPRKEIYQWFSI